MGRLQQNINEYSNKTNTVTYTFICHNHFCENTTLPIESQLAARQNVFNRF